MSLRYFSLKHNYSITKRTAVVRNVLLKKNLFVFVFSVYCIFICDTYHFFLYDTSAKITSNLWLSLIFFHKIPHQFVIETQTWQNKKTKKRCQESIPKIFLIPWPRTNCGGKMKITFLIN